MEDDGEIPAEVAQMVERVRAGDVRSLARAISLVENASPLASKILAACFPSSGQAFRIGVTGSPGAGKSTLVDGLARMLRSEGKTVGILAVDPTSPYTGGAILGDRIRMQEHFNDAGLFLRSMATRGALGGLARSTAEVASIVEASGKEVILIETVGVGQDEVDIVKLADVSLVVLVPGMGDDVQSIKAGIMEIADIFVVNKSDREGADRVEQEIRALQSLTSLHGDWIPPIVRTVASSGEGLPDLVSTIQEFSQWLESDDRLKLRREGIWRERLREMIRHEVLKEFTRSGFDDHRLAQYAGEVAAGRENPYLLVESLVRNLLHEEASQCKTQ